MKMVNDYADTHDDMLLTTRWVLAEVANTLSKTSLRTVAAAWIRGLEQDPNAIVAKPSDELYTRGLKLYSDRPDKGWSLTDCISFVVMQDQEVTEALTGDRHFVQAGFKALFL